MTAPSEIEPVLVVLLLGLVTDYTVFFMAETRRRLRRGEPRLRRRARGDARGSRRSSRPPASSSPAARSRCSPGEMEFFRVFGPALARRALVVTLVCVTFVPAVLALAGPRLFGRACATGRVAADVERRRAARGAERVRRPRGALRASRRRRARRRPGDAPRSCPWARVPSAALLVARLRRRAARRRERRARADLAVSFIPSLPADSEPRGAAEAAARGFGPGILAPTEVVLEAPGRAERCRSSWRCSDCSRSEQGVAAVVGPAQPAAAPLEDLVVARDGGAARYVVLLARRADRRRGDRRHRAAAATGCRPCARGGPARGARVAYAGETALAAETVDSLAGDLRRVASRRARDVRAPRALPAGARRAGAAGPRQRARVRRRRSA